MVKRLIGSDTTGSDGSVSIPYTGTGAGIINMEVETTIDGTTITIPLTIEDYFAYDKATIGEKSTDWITNGITETTTDEGTTLSDTSARYYSKRPLKNDFELIVEMKSSANFRYGVVNYSITKNAEVFMNSPNYSLFKITRNGTTLKAYQSTNQGSTWVELSFLDNTLTTNEDLYFYMQILQDDRTITYKNLKAYAI